MISATGAWFGQLEVQDDGEETAKDMCKYVGKACQILGERNAG